MKHAAQRRPLLLLLAGLLPALFACSHSHGGDEYYVSTYFESEINDQAHNADYFGILRPGDRFFIDGHITDIPFDPFDPWNGYDPFDGFAFTADRPIHVEFRLYIDNPWTDLDVIVYDPQLGIDVGWFATGNNPEVGAVDVLAGGLDFHLVVESWVGISSYSMEIIVYALYGPEGGTEGDDPAPDATITADRIVDPDRPEAPAHFEEYAGEQIDEEPELRVQTTEIDPDTGVLTESSRTMDADG